MKKTLLFVLVLLGIAKVGNAQVVEDWVRLHEPHIYNDMPYRLMKPIGYEPNKSYPVIVSLHGVAVKMITGSDNGSTRLSSDRCDPEPVFLKWLFAQKLAKERR